MPRSRFAGPTLRIAACAAVTLLHASTGASEPLRGKDRRACIGAYEQGQELAQAAKLLRAREAMLSCAKPKCGEFIHHECAARYSRLEEEIPTVILLAKGDAGEKLVDVEVTLDGELFSATLDGRALAVDPGLHQFTFKAKRGTIAEQRTIIVQGERNRVISVSFGSADGEPTKPLPGTAAQPSRPIDEEAYPESSRSGKRGAAPYVAAGIGLAGLGGFALFTQWGRSDNAELTRCAPNCSEGTLDHIRNLYIVADVSLGVGIVALGAAAWLFLSSDGSKPPASVKTTAYTFDVRPSPSSVIATMSGRF
jgi:hypothetical protein